MLTAAIALPFGSTPSPNGWMPQFPQNRCFITCLLNVYVLRLDSAVVNRSLSRGTNHRSDPLRSQIEQLQARAPSIVPSTSNATRPQWQLPLYFMCALSLCSVAAESFPELDGEAVRLAGQPLHPGLVAVRGADRFRRTIAVKLDSIADRGPGERARGIQVLHGDIVRTIRAGNFEIRSFR